MIYPHLDYSNDYDPEFSTGSSHRSLCTHSYDERRHKLDKEACTSRTEVGEWRWAVLPVDNLLAAKDAPPRNLVLDDVGRLLKVAARRRGLYCPMTLICLTPRCVTGSKAAPFGGLAEEATSGDCVRDGAWWRRRW
jgi:hypothetical protein